MMTKKDYQLIAGVIRDLREPDEVRRRRESGVDDLQAVENTFARRLVSTNPRFNERTFREACRAS